MIHASVHQYLVNCWFHCYCMYSNSWIAQSPYKPLGGALDWSTWVTLLKCHRSSALNGSKLQELLCHYINSSVECEICSDLSSSHLFCSLRVSERTSLYYAFVWVCSSTDTVTYLAFHQLNDSDKITHAPLVEHFPPQTPQTTLQMHERQKIQFNTSVLVMHLERTIHN